MALERAFRLFAVPISAVFSLANYSSWHQPHHVRLPSRYYLLYQNYSDLRLFTGLLIAAFMVRKLTVTNAINSAAIPANTNTHQLKATR
jgi:hypothetical protein